MTDADNDLFQHSDPSHLAALRITKAVVAFPMPGDQPGMYDAVMLHLNRELSPLEEYVARTSPRPLIGKSPDVTFELDAGGQDFRLSGVTPKVLEANKDDLARYVAGISAGAVDAWGILGERQGALAEIEFAAQPQQ